jgi:hypothetical protein
MAKGTATAPAGLDLTVFNRIVDHQTLEVQALLANNLIEDLENLPVKEAIAKSTHPLFEQKKRTHLVERWRKHGKKAKLQSKENKRNPLVLAFSFLLFFAGFGLLVFNQTLMTTAVLTMFFGAGRIITYFIRG